MTAIALLKFGQDETTPPGGEAIMIDPLGGDVTITNTSGASYLSWTITLLETVTGSSLVPGVLATGTASVPTVVFTDAFSSGIDGCYRIMLDVSNGGADTDRDIRCIGLPDAGGYILPPPQVFPLPLASKPNEMNFDGQLKGWAGDDTWPRGVTHFMKRVRDASRWQAEGSWDPISFTCWPHTNVVPVLGDTGVLLPFGTPSSNTPTDYQVFITTAGDLGTAVFKLSNDGGSTFYITGVTVPNSGVYLIPSTGISLMFTPGNWPINSTYSWSTVFAALGDGVFAGNYRIVGDSVDMRLSLSVGATTDFGGGVGTPTSQGLVLPLPPGYVLDITKLPITTSDAIAQYKLLQVIATVQAGTTPIAIPVTDFINYVQTVIDIAFLGGLTAGQFIAASMLSIPIKPA